MLPRLWKHKNESSSKLDFFRKVSYFEGLSIKEYARLRSTELLDLKYHGKIESANFAIQIKLQQSSLVFFLAPNRQHIRIDVILDKMKISYTLFDGQKTRTIFLLY